MLFVMHGNTVLMLWLAVYAIVMVTLLTDVIETAFNERPCIVDSQFGIDAAIAIGFGPPPVTSCSARPSALKNDNEFQARKNGHFFEADAPLPTFESIKFNEDGALNITMAETDRCHGTRNYSSHSLAAPFRYLCTCLFVPACYWIHYPCFDLSDWRWNPENEFTTKTQTKPSTPRNPRRRQQSKLQYAFR
uniref:Secreted protein n=1 Tax=Panagrellus redivivus TaxID=6233 RepID=A0A7E4UNS4_PANRE